MPGPGGKLTAAQRKRCEDEILDLLIMAYAFGNEDACEMLNITITPTADEANASIYKEIAGKDWLGRVREYMDDIDRIASGEEPLEEAGTATPRTIEEAIEDIMRVADTDSHRVYNEASNTTAKKGGASEKTWNCMFINSRDTHMDLHGTTVPMEAEFYTFLGNHAMYPGQFGVAEEDCHCQCFLTYSK